MDTFIKIRVSSEDKAEFEAAAKLDDRSLSSWARAALKEKARAAIATVAVAVISPLKQGRRK